MLILSFDKLFHSNGDFLEGNIHFHNNYFNTSHITRDLLRNSEVDASEFLENLEIFVCYLFITVSGSLYGRCHNN